MESLASKVGSYLNLHVPTSHPLLKSKTYGFAIAIIVGIGGLAVGAAGFAGYFHVGALSNIAQVDAIIMMAAGGGGGITLLIVGVVGTVRKLSSIRREEIRQEKTRHALFIKDYDTKDGLVYGSEAWKIWNVEVLDAVPLAPQVDLSAKDKVLLYIPQRIRVHGKEQDFNLKALKKIRDSVLYLDPRMEEQFGNYMAPGWILIDKKVIPDSRGKDYKAQKKMVELKGCSLPSILEAIVLNLMVFAFTGERLYGEKPITYTRCTEISSKSHHVIVGSFFPAGLVVTTDLMSDMSRDVNFVGVACVQKF